MPAMSIKRLALSSSNKNLLTTSFNLQFLSCIYFSYLLSCMVCSFHFSVEVYEYIEILFCRIGDFCILIGHYPFKIGIEPFLLRFCRCTSFPACIDFIGFHQLFDVLVCRRNNTLFRRLFLNRSVAVSVRSVIVSASCI